MRSRASSELTFEPPPRLSWPVERRLTARAVAVWKAHSGDGKLPFAASFERDEAALVTGQNSISLSVVTGDVTVSIVGSTLSSVFGLSAGPLTGAGVQLGSKLRETSAAACEARAPVSFDVNLVSAESGAPLLTRGVVLPLLDAAGELTKALAVLTWKEGLSATATGDLRDELDRAIAAGGAARGSGGQLARSLAPAFTAAPLVSDKRFLRAWPTGASAWATARQTCSRAAADA